ncbi:DUF3014 domain-containing protein [Rheinheimera pleomorphica]|uniref:DUF3014 domain-containing protein n=1 Tax=Rheinheimera pleomorphica TaxID=2703963 RepID=UPI0019D59964|nr:DUF3014 domain-containing protein [Rheinheimera pleomorphica]
MQRLITLLWQNKAEVAMTEQKVNNNQQLYYAGIIAVVVVILLALWLLFSKDKAPEPLPVLTPEVNEPAVPAQVVQPEPETVEPEQQAETPAPRPEPMRQAEPEAPLPTLEQSDVEVKQRLLTLNWRTGLAGLFVTEQMLRNFVVQTDNIAQGQQALGHPLFQPLQQSFSEADDDKMQLNEQHFKRYEPYIQLLESVPPEQLVPLFNRYEPLLQQAYAELGYPDELYKNKLLAAIDMLLATPEVAYPLALERPAVVYTFADPVIEQLPAAQKQMIRLGPDNQQRVKALLRQYKQVLQQ